MVCQDAWPTENLMKRRTEFSFFSPAFSERAVNGAGSRPDAIPGMGLTAKNPNEGEGQDEGVEDGANRQELGDEAEEGEEVPMSCYVTVKYGSQQFRTPTQLHTRRPKWECSFPIREVIIHRRQTAIDTLVSGMSATGTGTG